MLGDGAPPAAKAFRAGTHRVVAPEQTIDRVRRLAPAMGITRVANVTGLDTIGIPVVMVCRPNSRSLAVAQGKGLTLAAAKASGLMESIESYHAERVTHPLKLASYEELRYTHRVVDPPALPRVVENRFHPNLRLLWIEGRDLLNDETVWLPYEMVHTDYTLPLPPGSGCFVATSNGLASGNHLLEAISHGISEVVERDATSLWRCLDERSQLETRLDLDSVDDPDCRDVLERYERASITVGVWETTTDIGLPSFVCAVVECTEDPLRVLYTSYGMGCHPTRDIALLRALTEAAQTRLTYISGSRDDAFRRSYELNRNPDVVRFDRAQLLERGPVRSFATVPTSDGDTLDEDVAWQLERLRSVGMPRVVVVNLTKPEFDLPVVRVVIPGLEGCDHAPGYTPGARAQAVLERLR